MIATNTTKTSKQFDVIIQKNNDLFKQKIDHYIPAMEKLNQQSVSEHMYTIAQYARSIEEGKAECDYEIQFHQLINYSTIALIKLERNTQYEQQSVSVFIENHSRFLTDAKDLMFRKNHDYGEAWRQMRISSMTDLILTKLLRIRQVQNNGGMTIISEGLDANFYDIINYCIFVLIRLDELKT